MALPSLHRPGRPTQKRETGRGWPALEKFRRNKAGTPPLRRRGPFARALGLMWVAVACVAGSSAPRAADPTGMPGPVAEGVYSLMKISGGSLIGLGELEIRGQTYQVSGEGGFKPFTIDSSGAITWSAGLNIMPEGWKLGRSVYSKDGKGRPLVRIEYTSPRGTRDLIDALKEK